MVVVIVRSKARFDRPPYFEGSISSGWRISPRMKRQASGSSARQTAKSWMPAESLIATGNLCSRIIL